MAPGGEMFRYPQHFGKNVLRHGSHEWLPYSVDAVCAEIVKHQFIFPTGIAGQYENRRAEGVPLLCGFVDV